jgi:dTMP kinase
LKELPLFVVFEGLDGSGKTTQAKLLVDRILADGGRAELVADPGTTALGLAVRQILLHSDEPFTSVAEMLLFSAARVELAEYIRGRLADGVTIVCDRWLLSTLVYQGELNGVDELLILNTFANTAKLVPDLCVFLDLVPDAAMQRIEQRSGQRRDRYERRSPEDWRRMYDAYIRHSANKLAGRALFKVGGAQSPAAVNAQVYQAYKSHKSAVVTVA